MKLIITGASGYLGSRLARYFVESTRTIGLLAREQSDLSDLQTLNGDFIPLRFSSNSDIAALLYDFVPDLVIHTAGNYGRDGDTPEQVFDANVRFGTVLLEALPRLEKRVTFINSGSALPPEVSFYAFTKDQFSQTGRTFSQESNGQIQFINLRLQHFYGPNDRPSKFTSHVIGACQNDVAQLDLTEGQQRRDLIYIDDVVRAFATIVEARDQLDSNLDIDVGSGTAPTIREFVELVHRLTRSKTRLNFGAVPLRDQEPLLCRADLTQLDQLGWRPHYDLETGLKTLLNMDERP